MPSYCHRVQPPRGTRSESNHGRRLCVHSANTSHLERCMTLCPHGCNVDPSQPPAAGRLPQLSDPLPFYCCCCHCVGARVTRVLFSSWSFPSTMEETLTVSQAWGKAVKEVHTWSIRRACAVESVQPWFDINLLLQWLITVVKGIVKLMQHQKQTSRFQDGIIGAMYV